MQPEDRNAGRTARESEIRELLQAALDAQDRLNATYGELAAHPDPGGPREDRVAALQATRRDALYRLGLATLQAHIAGARPTLVWDSAVDAAPAVARQVADAAPTPQRVEAPAAPMPVSPTPEPRTTVRAVQTRTEPTPRGPAADPAALMALARSGLGPNWESQREDKDPGALLHAVMDALGPPLLVDDEETLERECRRITREADRLERWLQLDRSSQQLLLTYAAAKARYLQDGAREARAGTPSVAGLDPAFRTMNRYAKEYRPGFVWGLSRSQSPKHGGWHADAELHWQDLLELAGRTAKVETNPERALARLEAVLDATPDDDEVREAALDVIAAGVAATDPRLLRMLEPYLPALEGRSLKPVRRAIRQALYEEDDDTEDEHLLPSDWAPFEWTRGRSAVVVGGDRRVEAADRLQQTFLFDEVEWDSDVQGTKLTTIAERVRNGSVDMVIFLARLSSHSSQAVLLDACKDSGVPFVRVERGYGVSSVRLAIEQLHGQVAQLT